MRGTLASLPCTCSSAVDRYVLVRCLAELAGRRDGYCGGMGGSVHLADVSKGILGANGVVGASLGLGCGAGLAAKLEGQGRVAVAYFGDGASNQGLFHEALNMAAIWRLPVLFVCENNQVGLSTDIKAVLASDVPGSVLPRAQGYGAALPADRRLSVDGSDVLRVREAVAHCVEAARRGQGPSVIEALTHRLGGHNVGQNLKEDEIADEERAALRKDPLFVLRGHLVLSLGDEAAAAAIQAIEVRGRGGGCRSYYGYTHLPWLPLLLPGACGRGG